MNAADIASVGREKMDTSHPMMKLKKRGKKMAPMPPPKQGPPQAASPMPMPPRRGMPPQFGQ